MSTYLVTGADGFIGSHLVEYLLKNDINVKAFCFYNSNSSFGWLDDLSVNHPDGLELVLGDVRDYHSVYNAMRGCTHVLHLAALIAIPYSYVSPQSYVDTNITGTLNVLQAARQLDVERLIVTSTSETYGTAQFVPITEEHQLVGQSPYASTKIGADHLALSFYRSFSTPVSILRPFNTYGPRQSNRAVIPTIISQILSGSKNIQLGSVTPTRDFNYVEDTCSAFLALSVAPNVEGKVFNSASNFEISILDTAMLIANLLDVDISIVSNDERQRPPLSEVNRLYGDNTKLLSHTSWSPAYSGLEGFRRGLQHTIDWFSNSSNLSFYNSTRYSI